MAATSGKRIYLWKADGAISEGCVVKAGSDDNHVALAGASSDKFVGIAQVATTTAEDKIEVAIPGGGAKGLAGGSISFGDLLTSDASGKLIASTTNKDHIIGKAMHSAVSGDMFWLEVVAGSLSA